MDKIKSIVISGANGRVANHFAKLLLENDYEVHATARDVLKLELLKQQGAKLIQADFFDSVRLTQAFAAADAVFVYSPLILQSQNLNEDQYTIIDSLIKAIKNAAVKNVMLLSSWGVELQEKTGGIAGCRYFEQELEKIQNINTLILRPVWFMENFLYNIGLIKMAVINGLAIHPDVKFPMVTTEDIAAAAHQWLNENDLNGRNILYIKNKKEYSMKEVTQILGEAVGKKNLPFMEFPQSIQKKGMIASGQLSANGADMLIEINRCISSGVLKIDSNHLVKITDTTLEKFAKETFAPAFEKSINPTTTEKLQGFMLKFFLKAAGKKMIQREKELI